MKICSQCGNQNEDSLNFCTGCGNALSESSPQTEVPPAQPPYQQPQYQQPQHQQPQYQQPSYTPLLDPPPGAKGKAIAALVLGIVGILSVVTYWIPYFNIISFVASIIGIIYGVKGRNEIPVGYQGRGLATAGLVLAIIGVVFSGIGVLSWTLCISCAACASYSSF